MTPSRRKSRQRQEKKQKVAFLTGKNREVVMNRDIRGYEAVAGEKLMELGRSLGRTLAHGSAGVCPSCGHAGLFDIRGAGLSAASIYYSLATGSWRCPACELDPLGY